MVDGGELELDEHHVIAQPHRQVQRRRTGQEIVHLEQEKDDLECRLCKTAKKFKCRKMYRYCINRL